MRVVREISLADFPFWSGAKDLASNLSREELNQVESMLEDVYPDGMDETQINDLFWFDPETVCEWLGLSYDEVMGR